MFYLAVVSRAFILGISVLSLAVPVNAAEQSLLEPLN